MDIIIKKTKKKNESVYKTIYIKEDLAEKIEKIASKNETSFNNVVISMIETCVKGLEKVGN